MLIYKVYSFRKDYPNKEDSTKYFAYYDKANEYLGSIVESFTSGRQYKIDDMPNGKIVTVDTGSGYIERTFILDRIDVIE